MNLDLKIRQAHLADLPYVYEICRLTGDNGKDSSDSISDKWIIGQYFAAPYLHFEIDTCFILENGFIPLGYIIGTISTTRFNAWMNAVWLPVVRKYYNLGFQPKSDFEQFLFDMIHRDCLIPDFIDDYPSHLHIDLLPLVQHKGYGTELIKKFVESVANKGSSGIHLSVGLENRNAINFYKKNGFFEIKQESGALFMGMKI